MDNVLQQLGIDCIFSPPYHPQSNAKLKVFHKYLKPTLKKLCEKDPDNWDKNINQILVSYHVTPHLTTAETSLFIVYGRDPNLPLHQLTGTHAAILQWSWFWMYRPQFTLSCTCHSWEGSGWRLNSNMPKRWQTTSHSISKLVTEYSIKTNSLAIGDLRWIEVVTELCLHREQWTLPTHRKTWLQEKQVPCNVKDVVHEPPVNLWIVDTTFGRAEKFINHPANLPICSPSIQLR